MAGYIPKEQLQAYTRWEADSFDPKPPPAPPAAPPPEPAPTTPLPTESTPQVQIEEVPDIPLPTAEDIERIHNEARDEGYAEGYQAGLEEGRQAGEAALQPHVDTLAALAEDFSRALGGLDESVAESLLAFGLELAQQLTKVTLNAQPESLLPVVREALAALPIHHGPVTLLVNPQDEELLQAHLGDQFSHAGWHIQGDAEISPGGCKLRAGASEVDATLQTRWKRSLEAIGLTPEWLEART